MIRRQFIKGVVAALGLLLGWRKAKAVAALQPCSGVIKRFHCAGDTVKITTCYFDEGGIYYSINGGKLQKIDIAPYWHGKFPIVSVPAFKAPWK